MQLQFGCTCPPAGTPSFWPGLFPRCRDQVGLATKAIAQLEEDLDSTVEDLDTLAAAGNETEMCLAQVRNTSTRGVTASLPPRPHHPTTMHGRTHGRTGAHVHIHTHTHTHTHYRCRTTSPPRLS